MQSITQRREAESSNYDLLLATTKELVSAQWMLATGRTLYEDHKKTFKFYEWSETYVRATSGAGSAEIQRIQADSKFFRSFVLVLIVGLYYVGFRSVDGLVIDRDRQLEAVMMGALLLLALWRFFKLRWTATRYAYEYYIQLRAEPPDDTVDRAQKAG